MLCSAEVCYILICIWSDLIKCYCTNSLLLKQKHQYTFSGSYMYTGNVVVTRDCGIDVEQLAMMTGEVSISNVWQMVLRSTNLRRLNQQPVPLKKIKEKHWLTCDRVINTGYLTIVLPQQSVGRCFTFHTDATMQSLCHFLNYNILIGYNGFLLQWCQILLLFLLVIINSFPSRKTTSYATRE